MKRKAGKYFENMSIRSKLSFFILLAVGICLVTGQSIQYRLAARQMRERDQEYARANVQQISTYMETKIKNVIERLYYIRLDPSFSNAVENLLLDKNEATDSLVVNSISSTLSLYKISEPLISSMYFYTPRHCYTDNTFLASKDFIFEETAMYERMIRDNETIIWEAPRRDPIFISRKNVIPVLYKFHVSGYSRPVALLANLDQRALYDYLTRMPLSEDVSILLYDRQGNCITSLVRAEHEAFVADELSRGHLPAMLAGGTDFFTIRSGTEEYWLDYSPLETAPWSVVYLRTRASVYAKLSDYLFSFILLNTILAIVIFAAVTAITKKLTRPLYILSGLMAKAGEEKYELDVPFRGENEIGVLAKSFNHMVVYTRELFAQLNQSIEQLKEEKERVRIQQLLKRRAELKALQAQINPHFLYNTLDSIRWKAEEIQADDISQMTQALATVFRIGLSRGRELITLTDEISHADSYLEIQCLRYGERLSYRIEIGKELCGYYVVKLILQPLVENAIYHGIKEMDGAGCVAITGVRDGSQLMITVADNGVGIDAGSLEVLNEGLRKNLSVSREGYGIFNVNERIKLYFGDSYGLVLYSEPGKGTRAVLTMPVIEEWEVEEYVPYSDSRR